MSGARLLAPGQAEAPPLLLEAPLSFWGGFDSASGQVIDRFHPQFGQRLSGMILFMERGRGSSSGASVLAEAIRLGTAPAGICLLQDDEIIAVGALVAGMLYDRHCPVVVIGNRSNWTRLGQSGSVAVSASQGAVGVAATG